jgi:hypothetical protein
MINNKTAYFFANTLEDIPLSHRQDYGLSVEDPLGHWDNIQRIEAEVLRSPGGYTWGVEKPRVEDNTRCIVSSLGEYLRPMKPHD